MDSNLFSASEFGKLDRNQDGIVNVYDFILVKQEVIHRSSGITPEKPEKITAFAATTDATTAATIAGWASAMSEEHYVITSCEELETVAMKLFRPAVVRSLKKTYDEAFFAEQMLCLNLWVQEASDDFDTMQVADISCTDNQLQITCEKEYINGFVGERRVLISQVAVPQHAYDAVSWSVKNAQPVAYTYRFDSLEDMYYDTGNGSDYATEPVLFTSYAQLQAYKESLPVPQLQEMLNSYTAAFFEQNVLYLRPVFYAEYGASEQVWSVAREGNSIIADVNIQCPPTDFLVGTFGFGQLVLKKSDVAEMSVSCREHRVIMQDYMSNEIFAGSMSEYNLMSASRSLCVNQYTFREEHAIEFYWLHHTSGGMWYELLDSVSLDTDFNPFTSEELEGEDYTIFYDGSEQMVTVRFREAAGADTFRTLQFPVR